MPASLYGYVPQCVERESPRDGRRASLVVWGVVALGALVFAALIVSAPLALAGGHIFYADVIYRGFRLACHQIAERSFYVAGYPLAVCARCTGIYAGFAAAALAYPLVRSVRRVDAPARVWLIAAALPLALDFALGFFGIVDNTHLSRFATGALLSAVSVFYVIPGLLELRQSKRWRDFFQFRSLSGDKGRS